MNEQEDVYKDTYLEREINYLNEQYEKGFYPCCSSRLYCCPTLSDVGVVDFRTDEVKGVGGFVRDRNHFIDLLKPYPGIKLPQILEDYHPPTLVEATFDQDKNRVTIVNGEDILTFTNVMPWEHSADILKEINDELQRKEHGFYCWKLIRLPKQMTAETPSLLNGPIPRINNQHVNMLLTGYAIEEYHGLVYCGVVGHKTEVLSLRATLCTRKPLFIQHGHKNHTSNAEGSYEYTSEYLREIASHHAAFISYKALPGKWDPSDTTCYALVFQGAEDVEKELHTAFLGKLQEALDYPLLDTWAKTLYDWAIDNSHAKKLITGGDCLAGVKINLSQDWKRLLERALEDEAITI